MKVFKWNFMNKMDKDSVQDLEAVLREFEKIFETQRISNLFQKVETLVWSVSVLEKNNI